MFEFHTDSKKYFEMQTANALEYVLPFIEEKIPIKNGMRVLEIGCGEGGVLKAFVDHGCIGVGVEFDKIRIENASLWMADEIDGGKVSFVSKDIYQTEAEELDGKFDIIILKDVIEHIHDQAKLLQRMHQLLVPKGVIFFGFPPWQMPFGGHQQICKNKWLSRMPYYHLLPKRLYAYVLKRKNENVDELLEIKETGISIERFERITKQTSYRILHKRHFLINPIYKWKFNIKPRRQFAIIRAVPYLRNFLTTCVYYLIEQ
ncbi:MAG TPA: class I SAM-dependent methyltransferase [Arachidicoccus soli]|uniref:Class I SAM-dependent methyltransferase n=1 Tax=Arachidicoccus soli TaxID=2341117 RepID=A0A386HLY8_9BACT|nr:class I SAM-dependent methyltransferase [Arachidicoccus soli]AYD46763.1 class I SAM-dependent methyltransferase [Arachidicoccus soli]HEU0226291.1 class I SAM-dependent methyltransferase [Arachidicoccus soli]